MATKRPTKLMAKRAIIVFAIVIVLGLGVDIFSLGRLQLVDPKGYAEKAASQQLSDTTVNAQRGTIYDSNMNVIAQSATAWKIYLVPSKITDEDMRKVIVDGLSEILSLDKQKLEEKTRLDTNYVVIAEKVENEAKKKVSEFKLSYKGLTEVIGISSDNKRYYPQNNFAASVIGFTGSGDIGRSGIELEYNSKLTGVPGRIISAVNAWQDKMASSFETSYDAQNGTSIVLTIDEVIQHYLETSLEQARQNNKATYAYGIVMQVKTGAILAMTTQPDYDLNDPYEIADATVFEKIKATADAEERSKLTIATQYSQWRNRCISDTYEPGSVFKCITASAGLEEGVVTLDETLNCTGKITIAGRTINCANHSGHGVQNFTQGLMNSCNPWFVTVGQRLGTQKFSEYFEAFGLTEQTGIDLPAEAKPVMGVTYYNPKTMTISDLASASFGQTVKVTPLQMITAISAIGNGGKLMQPYIVDRMLDSDGNVIYKTTPTVKRQVISEKVASQVATMMEAVATNGGGQNAYVAGYHVAGKTGTSEKLENTNEKLYIASFCCFAPANDPEIAVIIIVDEPRAGKINGSSISAPVAGEVVENTLKYLNVEPNYSAKELAKLNGTAPTLVNLSVSEAKKTAEGKGFTVRVIGSGDHVISQMPGAASSMPKNGLIILYTEEGKTSSTTTVPNLVGMTLTNANKAAINAGLNIKISGTFSDSSSVVSYKQSLDSGSNVPMGTTVTVYFKDDTVGNDIA
ncbi:MAG: PASTA domain-containing protein [Clostridiales bacterium]|nr:PASTA domain-containing protein [Clostridiales bacterium]